ncbi:transposase [Corynebacterium maris]
MNTLRTRAWNTLGPRNPAVRATVDNPLFIDLDATDITAHSDKERASTTWKKHFGFHPLCAFIDLGDDHGGEVLAIQLRTGKAGANRVADHLDVLDAAWPSCRITRTANPGANACCFARMPAAGHRSSSSTSTHSSTVI